MESAARIMDPAEIEVEQLRFQDRTIVDYSRRAGSYTMPEHHFHDVYEIYFLLSGSRYYFIQDNTYYIRAGDLVLIDKYEIHRTVETLENTHERILFHMDESMLQDADGSWGQVLQELFSKGSIILSFDEAQQRYVRSLTERILAEMRQRDSGYGIVIMSLIAQILAFALRNREQQRKTAEDSLKFANKRIFEILDSINQEFAKPLTLSGVAQQFFISKFYLSHAFKDVTGFTFVEYLNNVRVREAQRLLKKTSLPVSRIAEETGFESVTHFGRVFKKISNVSPLQYRKQERGGRPPL